MNITFTKMSATPPAYTTHQRDRLGHYQPGEAGNFNSFAMSELKAALAISVPVSLIVALLCALIVVRGLWGSAGF